MTPEERQALTEMHDRLFKPMNAPNRLSMLFVLAEAGNTGMWRADIKQLLHGKVDYGLELLRQANFVCRVERVWYINMDMLKQVADALERLVKPHGAVVSTSGLTLERKEAEAIALRLLDISGRTPTRFIILHLLAQAGERGLHQEVIAQQTGLTEGGVSLIIQDLINAKLVWVDRIHPKKWVRPNHAAIWEIACAIRSLLG